MLLYPNCKINLGLRVVCKREDGYHDLETIFVPIYGLHDELEVLRVQNTDCCADRGQTENEILFEQEGLAVDCAAEDNLIIRCYRSMAAKYPQIAPVHIRFKKNIPFGAGLGGGSSDAAHMAIALNNLFELGLSREQLAAEVRPLGADCPFFIYNTPCYAEGIGDILTPVDLPLQGVRVVLIKPNEGVSTKEAYAGILEHRNRNNEHNTQRTERQPEMSLRDAVCTLSSDPSILIRQGGLFRNDFEQTVFPHHPAIAAIKKRLLDAGAIYASMSGSGSTVFGLFEDDAEGRTAAKLRLLEQEFASMVLLNDTFGEWQA